MKFNQKKTMTEAANRIKSFENEWLLKEDYYQKPAPKFTSGQRMDPVDNILEEIKLLGRKLPMVLKVRINKESVALTRLEFELDEDEVIDGSKAGKILSNLVAGKFKEAGLNPDEYINPAKYTSGYNYDPQWKDGEYDNRYCRFVQYDDKYSNPTAIFSINRVAGGKGISSAIGGDVLTDAIKEAKKYFRGQGIVRHFRDMSKSGVIRIKFAVEPYGDIITLIREVFEEYIGDALIDVKVINTPHDHYSWHNKDQMIAVYVNASKIDDMNREVGMKGYAGDENHRR